MNNKFIKASKFISLLLRHKPETIGLELDECGWANIDTLIELSSNHGHHLDSALIEQVASTSDKQRFAISDCGQFIRANQGHSIPVELNLEPRTPPDILYHGTATRFAESIFARGLMKRTRQHVHLSANQETATSVGKRHGKLLMLTIASGKMHTDGYVFFQSKNRVWLTEHVPIQYLTEEINLIST